MYALQSCLPRVRLGALNLVDLVLLVLLFTCIGIAFLVADYAGVLAGSGHVEHGRDPLHPSVRLLPL